MLLRKGSEMRQAERRRKKQNKIVLSPTSDIQVKQTESVLIVEIITVQSKQSERR